MGFVKNPVSPHGMHGVAGVNGSGRHLPKAFGMSRIFNLVADLDCEHGTGGWLVVRLAVLREEGLAKVAAPLARLVGTVLHSHMVNQLKEFGAISHMAYPLGADCIPLSCSHDPTASDSPDGAAAGCGGAHQVAGGSGLQARSAPHAVDRHWLVCREAGPGELGLVIDSKDCDIS